MNSVNKSVLRVNKFFKQLENYNSNKIIVHTDKINALCFLRFNTITIVKVK